MHREVAPTLAPPPGADIEAYKQALLRRFRNPGLRHRTWQIAMDGSQKIPQRLLGTVRDRLNTKAPIDGLALAVAAWMRFVTGIDEAGEPIDVRDPMRDRLQGCVKAAGLVAERLAPALLSVEAVFGRDLPANPSFVLAVTQALDSLIKRGTQQTLDDFRRLHP
jgi:fructuronate reductase